MMAFLHRLFHRPPKAPPDTPATIKAEAASRRMDATITRIDETLADLERRETLRRIRRTGNFAEGYLVPDRPEERT